MGDWSANRLRGKRNSTNRNQFSEQMLQFEYKFLLIDSFPTASWEIEKFLAIFFLFFMKYLFIENNKTGRKIKQFSNWIREMGKMEKWENHSLKIERTNGGTEPKATANHQRIVGSHKKNDEKLWIFIWLRVSHCSAVQSARSQQCFNWRPMNKQWTRRHQMVLAVEGTMSMSIPLPAVLFG